MKKVIVRAPAQGLIWSTNDIRVEFDTIEKEVDENIAKEIIKNTDFKIVTKKTIKKGGDE